VTAVAVADDDDDNEVLSTSYDGTSLDTAQRSERQMKSTSRSSHINSGKPPVEEKRKIMFGKILPCFLITVEVILATTTTCGRFVKTFFFSEY